MVTVHDALKRNYLKPDAYIKQLCNEIILSKGYVNIISGEENKVYQKQ